VGVLLFPEEGVTVLPLGFPLALAGEEGVLSGIRLPILHKPLNLQEIKRYDQVSCLIVYAVIESIAQMVCFSFTAWSGNRHGSSRFSAQLQIKNKFQFMWHSVG
jgi:hypothetical protein